MRGVPSLGFCFMDRREFIKACSVVALMQVLWGCRRLPDLSGAKVPEIAECEKEVRLALSRAKGAFDLVQVPMPGALDVHGASPVNRFGMAYPTEEQIVRYIPVSKDYVRQYAEIPG